MPQYSKEQESCLRELRVLFGEQGFFIFNLKRRKHESEFVARKKDTLSEVPSAVVRLYRGRVRIQLFHADGALNVFRKIIEKRFPESEVFFAHKLFNPTYKGNYRTWEYVASRKQVTEYLKHLA